jgi:4'-phosphopantetheinyl transferase
VSIATIAPNEVQVWHYKLKPDGNESNLAGVLDEEERKRAARFHFEKDRLRFIAKRGILRVILSKYTQTPPEAIDFDDGTNGKPLIVAPRSASMLRFSTSSSEELAAVAIAYDRELGLDVEKVKVGQDPISSQLAKEEADYLNNLEPDLRAAAFFDLWTCKEAYLKGKGLGLSVPLNQFAITIDPPAPRLLWSDLDAQDINTWSLHRLFLQPGFAACLAVWGGRSQVHCNPFVW